MDYDMGGDCGDPPPLVLSTDTALLVDREALAAYGARGPEDVSCCYTAMWRVRPGVAVPDWPRGHTMPPTREGPLFDGITHGDHIRFGDRCEPFFEAAAVVHEFVRVNCTRLGARSMLGYNKVEDNTFPNLVALLSGMSVPELRKTCWGSDNTAHFDACPWVWKRFRREGYVNMFAEDSAWMGLFHYLKRGFVLQPTEYDPRPLLYLGGKHLGRALRRGSHQVCIGQRRELDVLLDYGRKFVRAMQRDRRKFFGIVWGSSMSHDDLNSASAADEAYADYLGDVLATGVLNRTALVFISDHGLRFGDILTTRQGRLEERLPLMYTVLPEWVRRRYPRAVRNLEGNANRLVTLYDVHETLYNYMHLPSLRALEGPPPPPASGAPPPRGRSLFSQIPDDRTCATAGVPKHYCACQTTVAVPADDHRRVRGLRAPPPPDALHFKTQSSLISVPAGCSRWPSSSSAR
ncbi:hypothetical protein ONE63_003251 [Megalurothrips usitatus]|uniref:Uncharacterized protein n=1 Tax=Megalurothrips usitatus TaxID=439358 RepID=A0AAV7XB63_9NEOP|nr:hypothetical protein ONE63_003251 [Megalurothrips usitatus]